MGGLHRWLTGPFLVQDMETLDLEDFSYNNVNMTAFRMVDADDPGVKEALRQMERFAPIGHHIINSSGIIQVTRVAVVPEQLHQDRTIPGSTPLCFLILYIFVVVARILDL